jgi:seryl-tRNA synthetase
MKKVVAVCVAVAFAAGLLYLAFSQEQPPARGARRAGAAVGRTAMTEEQREEMRKAMERLREINQNAELREITVQARQKESVVKANEAVTKAQEALATAQENAQKALNTAIATIAKEKGNEELIKLVEERNAILEKLGVRGRFFGGAMMGPRPSGREGQPGAPGEGRRQPRRRPAAAE